MNGQPPNGQGSNGHGSNGQGILATVRRPEAALPAVVSHAPPLALQPTGMVLDQKSVLAAVRRRWLVASVLGVLGGLLGAACAWFLIPVSYTARAELRIQMSRFVPGGKPLVRDNDKIDTFRQTLARQVQGQMVLKQTIRRADIAKLQTIREVADPHEYLEKTLKISNPGKEFISVSLTGPHQADLAPIVNAVVDVFIKEVTSRDAVETTKMIKSIDDAKSDVRAKLDEWRRAKEKLVKRIGANDASSVAAAQAKEQFYSELRKSLSTAKIEQSKIRAELSLREAEESREPAPLDERAINMAIDRRPEVQSAMARLDQVRGDLARLERVKSNRNGELAKTVEDAEKKVAEIRESLRSEVVEEFRRQLDELAVQSTAQLKRQVQLRDVEITLLENQLVREDEARTNNIGWTSELELLNKQIESYDVMFSRLQDEGEHAKFALGSSPRVEKFRDATPPTEPDMGKKLAATALSGGGLFALIVVGILLLDLRTRRVNTLDDIVSGLRLPIIGSLPLIPASRSTANSTELTAGSQKWQGALIESVDSARVMLLRRASLENAKAVMISSAITSEGKTTMTCHLATSLARAGYRTVVIDADLRRPTVHRVFNVAAEPGLCEVLNSGLDAAAVVQPTSQEGLFVIASGQLTGDALRQLAQDGMAPLMERLRAEFDFIVVDTSPLLPVTDGLLIAQYVDGVILSVRRDVSHYPKVSAACQKLQMMGAPVWGAVVIGLDQSPGGYRYSYGYGYGYGAKADQSPSAATSQAVRSESL